MDNAIAELVNDLVRGHPCTVHERKVWLDVVPDGVRTPDHGWKLHVSSRPATFARLAAKLVPVLLAEGCRFKLAKSEATLAELNDGLTAPTSVGKAFTIYPAPDRIRPLGWALVDLLRGEPGPRILSDRRLDDSAPVYYRYGPIGRAWTTNRLGRLGMDVRGPHGEEFDAEATVAYRQPSWERDPFEGDRRSEDPDDELLLGERYRVTEGLYESVRGNLYRAVDEVTGETVIVKQARALVAESRDAVDTRLRIRNERRILQAVPDLPGLPRFVDHFKHLEDEFLVTTDQGSLDLRVDIEERGPYLPEPGAKRSLWWLATELSRILGALHERGIVMRDLAPKNIVLRNENGGELSVVDFGMASYEGVHLLGGTRGYCPERQWLRAEPEETDDLYALGMTLIEALTGLSPIQHGEYADTRTRALESVRAKCGEHPEGLVAAIVDLVNDDPAVVRAGFARIHSGPAATASHRATTVLPKPPAVTPESVGELVEHTLHEVLAAADEIIDPPETSLVAVDISLFSGMAGIGAELLHHITSPGVAERVNGLLGRIHEILDDSALGPGLLLGRTGVEVFLEAARSAHAAIPGIPAIPAIPAGRTGERPRHFPHSDWEPFGYDVLAGAAGVGLGHLFLYRTTGDVRDLEVAQRCAAAVADEDPDDAFLAHGLAGIVLLHLQLAEPSDGSLTGAREGKALGGGPMADTRGGSASVEKMAESLAARTRAVLDRAAKMQGSPLYTVSWCNGMAGAARVLLAAGERLGRTEFTALAFEAADACLMWVPRLISSSQCCGATGIGELLIDLSQLPGGERFRSGAFEVAQQLLLRSAGPPERPTFTHDVPGSPSSSSWANGVTGILGFLRRLRDGGGERILVGL